MPSGTGCHLWHATVSKKYAVKNTRIFGCAAGYNKPCRVLFCLQMGENRQCFALFFPDEYLDSTYVIDFEKLYAQGYRGLIFDIDNTLVPHGEPADERQRRFLYGLKRLDFSAACCQITSMKEFLLLTGMYRYILLRMRISHPGRITEGPWS